MPKSKASEGKVQEDTVEQVSTLAAESKGALGDPVISSFENDQRSNDNFDVVARVGSTAVSMQDIQAEIDSLPAKERDAALRDPVALNQTVRTILLRRLVWQDAQRKKWEPNPALAARLERARRNTLAEHYLQSITKPTAAYPSEEEIQRFYETNKTQLLMPTGYQLAQIFVAQPKRASSAEIETAETRLKSIVQQLGQPGAGFAEIADAQSDDKNTAGRGGEIGWLTENQLKPEIRSQVLTLSKGTVSEPVRLDDGWHILKLLDLREAQVPTANDARPWIIRELRLRREQLNKEAYIARLQQQTPILINELSLRSISEPAKTGGGMRQQTNT